MEIDKSQAEMQSLRYIYATCYGSSGLSSRKEASRQVGV